MRHTKTAREERMRASEAMLTTSGVTRELASLGVEASEQSVRAWERAGLLRAAAKSEGGLRLFSRQEVGRFAEERRQRKEGRA
jgi:DNA-binding transcriptional MerR regulator